MELSRGPVGAVVEAEVLRWVQAPGIVVWLDREGVWRELVEGWVSREGGWSGGPVVVFRGSWLEVMMALAPRGNGLTAEPLLVYVPGFDGEMVRRTPVLELVRAGRVFERSLGSAVEAGAHGLVSASALEAFLSGREVTLAGAEAWLAAATASESDALGAMLGGWGLERLVDNVLGTETELVARFQEEGGELGTILEHLARHVGVTEAFVGWFVGAEGVTRYTDLEEVFAGWLMAVEYVTDLQREPLLAELRALRGLPAVFREASLRAVRHFRGRHEERYALFADVVEGRLEGELQGVEAELLGSIDTFRAEERRVLEAALRALSAGNWGKAGWWAAMREEAPSFWVRRELERKLEWELVGAIAALGEALEASSGALGGARTVVEAVEAYTGTVEVAGAWVVDQAHRRLEQQRAKLLRPHLTHFADLLAAANGVRARYRAWADGVAGAFEGVCEEEGFLPGPGLQQRRVFEEVVEPLVGGRGRVAWFVLEGLRYEMAEELRGAMEGPQTRSLLRGRLAELPTVGSVGLNALAPVHRGGRLVVAGGESLRGFRVGEFTVSRSKDRVRAITERVVDPTAAVRRKVGDYTLAEVCGRTVESLKLGHGGADLLVVHDQDGEELEGVGGIGRLEARLGQVVAAWRQLKQLGFEVFVITSSHGFALRDETVRVVEPPTDEAGRRFAVVRGQGALGAGSVGVRLSDLGYEGVEGVLAMPRGTAVYRGGGSEAVVSGGGSPQERVVPVLVVQHGQRPTVERLRYALEAEVLEGGATGSRLSVRVRPLQDAQTVLSFTQTEPVRLGLRAAGRADVTATVLSVQGGELVNETIVAPVEGGVSVSFGLSGRRDEKVRVELYAVAGQAIEVSSVTLESYFPVVGQETGEAEAGEPAGAESWSDGFDDADVVRVLRHIQQHGSISEAEVVGMVGGGRKARRFAAAFDGYLERVPFEMFVEVAASGKRYVRG